MNEDLHDSVNRNSNNSQINQEIKHFHSIPTQSTDTVTNNKKNNYNSSSNSNSGNG
jgi:hypothetical protein